MHQAIWNWIKDYPLEFSWNYFHKERILGGPDMLFDFFGGLVSTKNKQRFSSWLVRSTLLYGKFNTVTIFTYCRCTCPDMLDLVADQEKSLLAGIHAKVTPFYRIYIYIYMYMYTYGCITQFSAKVYYHALTPYHGIEKKRSSRFQKDTKSSCCPAQHLQCLNLRWQCRLRYFIGPS